ncbi:MAG: spore cortex biosynthesis protein YabQ [Clostridia bacterium]|nr:spore cortex biosynthesis protein YabQ [Clostridia bacterium]
MQITVSSQAYIFLCALIGGMLIAFIYDLFRIKRRAIKSNIVVIYIEDFLYWVLVALIMFCVVYYSNDGELRGFIFIGSVLGVTVYVVLFSALIVNASLVIIGIAVKIARTIFLIITYPFRLIYFILRPPLFFLMKKGEKMARSVKSFGRRRMDSMKTWSRILRNVRKKI